MKKSAPQSKLGEGTKEQPSKPANKVPQTKPRSGKTSLPRYEASPIDLLQIALRFEFIVPAHFKEETMYDLVEEPDYPAEGDEPLFGQAFTRVPIEELENLYIQGLQNAAYLYDLAESVILSRREVNPRVLRESERRERLLRYDVLSAWSSIRKDGELLTEDEVLLRTDYKTEQNLRRAFHKFGYVHRSGQKVSATVVSVLNVLKENWERHQDAERKNRNRHQGAADNPAKFKHVSGRKTPDLLISDGWLKSQLQRAIRKVSVSESLPKK